MRSLPLLLLSLFVVLSASPAHALSGRLFGIGTFGNFYTVDPSTGAVVERGTIAGVSNAAGLARDPLTGELWFADHVGGDIVIKSVDPATLASGTIATLSGFSDSNLRDLAFLPDGSLYGTGWTPQSFSRHDIYAIDRALGTAAMVLSNVSGGIAGFDASTLLHLAGDGTFDTGTLTPFDDSASYTGDVTTLGTQLAYASDEDVAFLLTGCRIQCAGSPLFRIDRVAKTYTAVGPTGAFLSGIAVPEPGAAVLMLPLLALAFGSRRRR